MALEAAAQRENVRENDLYVARAEFDAKEDERLALLEDEEDVGEGGSSPDKSQLK
jgi:hypothetical protein